MGSVPPARRFDALRVLTWQGLPSRIAPDGGPPCAFAPLQRSIAAPPHRPAYPRAAVGRCFLSWAFVPYDTCGTADPFPRGFRPLGVPRPGFEPPSRRPPPSLPRLATRSVHGLRPPRRSPRSDRDPLRSPLPSWRSPRRFASLPWGACGLGRLQGFDPASSSFCRSGSRRTRRADAFLGLVPPELVPPPVAAALCSRSDPFARVGWIRRPTYLRLKGFRHGGPDDPSRGRRLSWDSSPKHGRDTA
jgi:hypothetical protein